MVDDSGNGGTEAQAQPRRILLGELLVQGSVLTTDQLAEALATPRPPGKKIGQLLVEKGWVTEAQLTQTLSLQLSVPWVSLYHIDFSRQLLNRVSREVAEKHCLIPIFVRHVKGQGETLYVAMDDPTNEGALVEVKEQAGLPAKPMIASATDIRSAIRVYYGEPEGAQVDVPVPPPVPARAPAEAIPTTTREGRPVDPPAATVREPSRASTPSQPPPLPARASQPPPLRKSVPPASDPTARTRSAPPPAPARASQPPPATDADAKAAARRRAGAARLLNLTLLDGTTLALPKRTNPKQPFAPRDGLTTGDYINALRAAAQGADASEVLGPNPRWEPVMAALLALLVKKGVVADWEIVEELRKM